MVLKVLEQALRMTLCACRLLPSGHPSVTSKKSASCRRSRKAPETLDSKSFHRRQKFSLEAPIFQGSCVLWRSDEGFSGVSLGRMLGGGRAGGRGEHEWKGVS